MGSCWAFGPYSGLDNESMWEPGVEDTFEKVGEMLETIEESVFATQPSSSWPVAVDVDEANPRVKKGSLEEKTYVAMSFSDGNREFVDVLSPDLAGGVVQGNTLTLLAPADGKEYKGARLVDGAVKLEFQEQADGSLTLTLPTGMQWGEYDTAIELTTKEILPADKRKLKEAVESVEQMETEKYTDETAEKFLAGLETAKILLDDDTLTEDNQAIVDEALNDLEKA